MRIIYAVWGPAVMEHSFDVCISRLPTFTPSLARDSRRRRTRAGVVSVADSTRSARKALQKEISDWESRLESINNSKQTRRVDK